MNQNQITHICKIFDLGIPTARPKRIYGGLLHLMWRIDTDKASYAIKELSKNINLKDQKIRDNNARISVA